MSPEVIVRKLSRMSQYLQDLAPYRGAAYQDFLVDHYKVERLLELLLMAASDIVFHLLSMRNEPAPSSCRAAFLRAGEMGILSEKRSRNR
jgi:uncharacterized protein YutE (UPF0331/DUF86 family)